jgi:hypothetical protein
MDEALPDKPEEEPGEPVAELTEEPHEDDTDSLTESEP